jgi:hypothetical protein
MRRNKQACWLVLSPLLIFIIWVFVLVDYRAPSYGETYQYPW